MSDKYTVKDIMEAGYNLEPLYCVFCGKTGHLSYDQYLEDGLCEYCGKWQIEDLEK